ncbi:hypothetical protein [Streptomyces chilikensis]|uniref:hypothetical protein n=1 Tax=Streptomyces chilikensis TaxID=1194079 RepID=UPI000B288E14|nr:hypothetical protein [Streptomyces chilikensis]
MSEPAPSVPALNDRTVDAPHRHELRTPGYDRVELEPAVVHFGVGGFHRAHQAVYFDELAELGFTRWGVIGVGMSRPEMGQVLDAQDNLFTVVQRGGADDSAARIVGCVTEYLLLTEHRQEVAERLADPRTRLVTLTITADGYVLPPTRRRRTARCSGWSSTPWTPAGAPAGPRSPCCRATTSPTARPPPVRRS